MGFSEKVTVIIETVSGNAKKGLDDFKTSVADADTTTGKFKAGVGSLKDSILGAATSPAGLAAGIGAVGVVVGKAVNEFKDATLEVGHFRDATGTTAEEASRFTEVFKDLGIGSEAGAAAIGKMEKALGANAGAFSQYGVEVVKAKDGTMDAQATFLGAVDALNAMKNPADRAAAGAAIFGKGWQSMSEIIGNGSDSLRKSLESVQPSKVFTDKDIQSGRDVRDAFDALQDSVDGLMLSLGKNLAPAVATASQQIAGLVDDLGPLIEKLGQIQGWKIGSGDDAFAPLAGPLPNLINGVQELAEAEIKASVAFDGVTTSAEAQIVATDGQERSQRAVNAEAERWTALAKTYDTTTQDAAQAQRDLAAASDRVTRSIDQQTQQWDALKGEISDEQAWLDMQGTFDAVRRAGGEAMDAVKNKSAEADAKMRDYQSSVNTAKSNVVDLGQQIGLSIPQVKDMLLQIDDGAIDQVEARLRTLTRNRQISIDIIAKGGAGYGPISGARAAGGPVEAGKTYMVGEKGPEPVTFGANGYVHPNSSLAGGGDTYVTVNTGLDPRAVANALGVFVRNGGRIPGIN